MTFIFYINIINFIVIYGTIKHTNSYQNVLITNLKIKTFCEL